MVVAPAGHPNQLPQFARWDLEVRVKNTFLHFDEEPTTPPMPQGLQRAKTAPEVSTRVHGEGSAGGATEFDSASSVSGSSSQGLSPLVQARADVPAPPPFDLEESELAWAPDGTQRCDTPDLLWLPARAAAEAPQMVQASPVPYHVVPVVMPEDVYGACQQLPFVTLEDLLYGACLHLPPAAVGLSGDFLSTTTSPGDAYSDAGRVFPCSSTKDAMPLTSSAVGMPPASVEQAQAARPIESSPLKPSDQAGGAPASVPAAPEKTARQPQTLTKVFDPGTGTTCVRWTVDARKLRGNDKQAVSPSFDLHFGSHAPKVPFKMMLCPNSPNFGRGGACFKKACGRGFVQLKCESVLSGTTGKVIFRFGIGNDRKKLTACGSPIEHDFSELAICDNEQSRFEWDFNKAVDQVSMTFDVLLEIKRRAA